MCCALISSSHVHAYLVTAFLSASPAGADDAPESFELFGGLQHDILLHHALRFGRDQIEIYS